jgi:uncharacterized delta-60 repeat protein
MRRIAIFGVGLLLAACGESNGELVGVARERLVDPDPGFSVIRYTASGVLDATFGTGGIVNPTRMGAGLPTVLLDGNDRILVASGATFTGVTNEQFVIARYNGNGTFDSSFGGDGVVYTNVTETPREFITALAVQPDGRIVAAGWGTDENGTFAKWIVTRYGITGLVDMTFGVNGRVITDFGVSAQARAVAIDGNGKIVVAGNTGVDSDRIAVARYNANGTPESDLQRQRPDHHRRAHDRSRAS